MFSFDIVIWASDTHQILDNTTKQILNRSKCGVRIGSHVWCGTKTIILKDAKISNNSVVGASSVVTKQFDEENIIVAGNPARKVKSNIIWKREDFN